MSGTSQAEAWPLESAEKVAPEAPPRLEFEDIYERWFDEVSRWIRAMGGPQADREDLVQDVFLVVHRRLPDFDGQNVAGWLYQIARHRVRDFRRLLWVRHLLFGSVPLSDSLPKGGASPADTLETSATVTFVPGEGITKIALSVRGTVPGVDEAAFSEAAEGAKSGCPVSKALAAVPEITLDATLA